MVRNSWGWIGEVLQNRPTGYRSEYADIDISNACALGPVASDIWRQVAAIVFGECTLPL